MILQDEELLQDYVTECREHLADIEAQLLALEASGDHVDESLINTIFRAAHSIKGGAGLLDLRKLKDLAHRTENVLGQIRSHDLAPTPEVVNILLLAFDRLRSLVNDVKASEETDVSDVCVALTGLSSSSLPADRKHTLTREVEVQVPEAGPQTSIRTSMFDFDRAVLSRQCVYLIECDVSHLPDSARHSPLELLAVLGAHGTILDCTVAEVDASGQGAHSLHVLFASAIDETRIRELSTIPVRRVRKVDASGHGDPASPVVVAPIASNGVPRIELPSHSALSGEGSARAPSPPQDAQEDDRADSAVRASVHPAETSADPPVHSRRQAAQREPTLRENTLRVNVALLESLMNLAGDLVLSRNQLSDAIARGDLDAIGTGSQRMSVVTSDLQQAIVQTRLQPIGNILSKFRRMVRDLSRELDKEIQLDIQGSEVEMDKAIIEGLSEPLTHMVRNAADHGIESLEERRRLGKNPVGLIEIRVQHDAGQVVVEVRDDGRGLDPSAISAAAVTRQVVTREQLTHMSTRDILALIFVPGVSTVRRVTEVSGRGVGMDVVKSNLDRLSGKIEIESELGVGTLFRFILPLTLAIIPSLLVSVAQERFAIPQVNLVELLRIPAAQAKERFELVGDAEVLILRGELIPILHLSAVLGIQRSFTDPVTGRVGVDRRGRAVDRRSRRSEPHGDQPSAPAPPHSASSSARREEADRRYHAASDINVAIVSAGSFRYGLVVEQLHDTLEIVVKPLGRHLKRLREYAGATILGDGTVALILDVNGLAQKAQLVSMAETTRARELAQATQRARQEESISLLVFRNAPAEQCAVPLAQVTRVEHVDASAIETLGGRRTMRYRGTSLPLVTLADASTVGEMDPTQERVVIVFEANGRDVGLLAARPVDAVDVSAMVDRETHRQKGVLGSAIVRNETTLIVDLMELLEATYPEWTAERRSSATNGRNGATILLAEDSEFFRGQVRKCIESAGYKVVLAEDGQAGWELLDQNAGTIDLLVTDIEMPRLTGLQLTRRVRADGRFESLPVVALSSLAGEDDMARGVAAGVTEYLVKLDGEKLLEAVHRLLKESAQAQA
ncbi:MAG: chemotaxis protein CheW [Deltaproteobacteria bacterium]|nr:chemotaxis protein CheW [Deltaproteobacteria bacterium]